MPARIPIAAAVAALTALTALPAPAAVPAAFPPATAAQRTHPHVIPARGTRHTAFAVTFTLRQAAGHPSGLQVDYRVAVDPPAHARAACRPPAPRSVTSGAAGELVRVKLPAPRHGWCHGRHTVTVLLQQRPYCPLPSPGQPPRACPAFILADVDTGHAHFVVG